MTNEKNFSAVYRSQIGVFFYLWSMNRRFIIMYLFSRGLKFPLLWRHQFSGYAFSFFRHIALQKVRNSLFSFSHSLSHFSQKKNFFSVSLSEKSRSFLFSFFLISIEVWSKQSRRRQIDDTKMGVRVESFTKNYWIFMITNRNIWKNNFFLYFFPPRKRLELYETWIFFKLFDVVVINWQPVKWFENVWDHRSHFVYSPDERWYAGWGWKRCVNSWIISPTPGRKWIRLLAMKN